MRDAAADRDRLTGSREPFLAVDVKEHLAVRATAYRYFPNRRALLTATFPELTAPSLLGDAPPADPQARLELVVDAIAEQSLKHEIELRNMLRLSLESGPAERDDLPFRRGRRIVWVTEALEPLRDELPKAEFDHLVYAIGSAVGIDSLIWLTDIGGLSRRRAVEVMRYSTRALLRAALAE